MITHFRFIRYRLCVSITLFGIVCLFLCAGHPWAADAPAVSTSTVPSAPPVATPPASTPPAKIAPPPAEAPPISQAEYIGAETCLSCHQNRANFKDSVHGHSLVQAKGISFEQTCETCHGPGSLHAAAAGDRSNPGFASIKNLKSMSAIELEKTCLECHQDENRMHWVGSVHEARDVSCTACHSIHSPQEDRLSLVKPTINQVCAQCHKDIALRVKRNAHMPVPEGKMSCANCHNPHGTANPKNLKADSVQALCQSCHADKRGPFLWEHPPVRETCLNCHDPHGSHHEKMLIAKRPLLCQRCHDSTRHPSTFYDNTAVNQQNNRLFDKSCLNCHTQIHGSNHPSGKFFLR